MPYDESTNTHAMCDWYGHEWKKHLGFTSKQPAGYVVQVCRRDGCDAARRVWKG